METKYMWWLAWFLFGIGSTVLFLLIACAFDNVVTTWDGDNKYDHYL